ncbi:MAG: hypothetical protein ACTH3G_13005 [Citricoccus sp.]
MTTLLLIHGRGQQTPRDFPANRVNAFAADLRGRWVQALGTGVKNAGREPIPGELQEVCEVKAHLLDEVVAHLDAAGVGRPWWNLDELLRAPWLWDALQFLARQAGVSTSVIESHFTDVAYYLLTRRDPGREVSLLVTTGSPLGCRPCRSICWGTGETRPRRSRQLSLRAAQRGGTATTCGMWSRS